MRLRDCYNAIVRARSMRARQSSRPTSAMVSPPLGETMALVGRDDCLARIDRARTMAL